MGDERDDVILVTGPDSGALWQTAFDRAEHILGTVPLVTLISASWDGERWEAWYHYQPMFPAADRHPEW